MTDPKDMTRLVEDKLAELKQLEDDVQFYSGNETAGYAAIARLRGEIGEMAIPAITTLLEEVGRYREALDLAARRLHVAADRSEEGYHSGTEHIGYRQWAREARAAALQGSVDRLNDEDLS